jgi:hypothetical protein
VARSYSTAALNDALGLLLLAVYISAIVGIAALVTYAVIKIFPTERNPKKPDKPDTPSSGNGVESTAGRLFRKAKRATT